MGRDLIRCGYCGMSYDGNEHDNCPHCLAPRSDDDEQPKATKIPVDRPDHVGVEMALDNGLITLNEARAMVIERHGGLTLYADDERYYVEPQEITYGDYVDGLVEPWYDPQKGRHNYTCRGGREPKEASVTLETADDWIRELSNPGSEVRRDLVMTMTLLGVTAFVLVALLLA